MSKGNYYSGSPFGSKINDDEFIDKFMSVVTPWVMIGILGLCSFGFYKLCKDDNFKKNKNTEQIEKTITPKDVIKSNNVKTY